MLKMGKPSGLNDLNSQSGNGPRLRVLLADDHPHMLDEVRRMLADEFEIVGSVAEGQALLHAAEVLRPDAVVSDINMPLVDGIEAGRRMLRDGLCPAVILLSMYNDPQLVRSALASGIRGYVLKVDAGEELAQAVETVAHGGTYLSRGIPRRGSR
jgi:DNA-binding NarL/FixJ family response regulator